MPAAKHTHSKKAASSQLVRAPKGMRIVVQRKLGKLAPASGKEIAREVRRQRKEIYEKYPTPPGMSRREYTKLHKLSHPFKTKYHSPMRMMSLFWWSKESRERQRAFRKEYPELRSIFSLTAKK